MKLLVDEPGSELAERIWNEADTVVASRLAQSEVSAALSAARRAARIDEAAERAARRSWASYWAAVDVVELTAAVAADAAALAGRLVLGGADAVHLACARTLSAGDPILVSWDRRLAVAGLEVGMTVVGGDQ